MPSISLTLKLDLDDILNSLPLLQMPYSSKRSTAYFGPRSYSYANTTHTPQPVSSNKYVMHCLNTINMLFSDAELNSVLINYYPTCNSFLSFHSDDEKEICHDSYIFTLSVGSSRCLHFRSTLTKKHLLKITLTNGSLLCFSKASQFMYQHAVLPEPASSGPRLSLTFRKLN